MIVIKDLTFKYENGDKNVLKNISLTIPIGGFLGIIGPSGAGKTTLLNTINGIVPHHYKGDYYGLVSVEGKDTFGIGLTDMSLSVGTVFQDIDSQIINAVVEDELLYGLENFGVPPEEIESRIQDTLDEMGISDLRYRNINTLSGGQKQKVAIASIIAMRPKILLLDEPTGELDPVSSRQIFAMLQRLNEQYGMTIVIVEQKIMLLSEFVKDLAVINNGQLLFCGPVRSVLEHSEELEKIGVNCPRVVTLWNSMKSAGISSGEICLNVDEAEQMVRKVLK
ncbi:MAG: energy-coupling factor ABC transporter ATP-binding protein [Clostridiales bacterium]|nr:energy-coupling factor ABC transporter ATP-binding protein [Clostridiales bacterium]